LVRNSLDLTHRKDLAHVRRNRAADDSPPASYRRRTNPPQLFPT
jgi:hypothetical protein